MPNDWKPPDDSEDFLDYSFTVHPVSYYDRFADNLQAMGGLTQAPDSEVRPDDRGD